MLISEINGMLFYLKATELYTKRKKTKIKSKHYKLQNYYGQEQ